MKNRKTFLDIAIRYYEYVLSQQDGKIEKDTLKILNSEGTASDEFKEVRKKFIKCLQFFGLEDRDIFKKGKEYSFFETDVDYFAKLLYRFTSKGDVLKKAKNGRTEFMAEEIFVLKREVDEFVGVISKYVRGEDKENICEKIYQECNYNQVKIEEMKNDVIANFTDILENTLGVNLQSSVVTCVYLTDKDRLELFKRLNEIIKDFKTKVQKVDVDRRDELYKNFITHKQSSHKDYTSLEDELKANPNYEDIYSTTKMLINCGVNEESKRVRENKFIKQQKIFVINHSWKDTEENFEEHNKQVEAYMDLIKTFENTIKPLEGI